MMRARMGRAVLLLLSGAALLLPAAGWGGSAASLDLVLRAAHTPTPAQLARSVAIVGHRAQLLGGSGVDVTSRGADEIVVHIASISDPGRAKILLASRGQLGFYDFEAHISARPARKRPTSGLVLRCGGGTAVCPGVPGSPVNRWYFYRAKGHPELTGAELVRGETRADSDPQSGQPVVLMQLTKKGQLAFLRITAAEARRGKKLWIRAGRRDGAVNYFQHFAIVLDGRIISFPSIDFQQYPTGITASNGIEITGLHGLTEAKGLALLLKTGTLPVTFTVQR
jgi:preprotein translocase subunit SecD